MAKSPACPICGKPPVREFAPFCSRGCKDRDLLQWLGEGYRLPGGAAGGNPQSGLDRTGDRD